MFRREFLINQHGGSEVWLPAKTNDETPLFAMQQPGFHINKE